MVSYTTVSRLRLLSGQHPARIIFTIWPRRLNFSFDSSRHFCHRWPAMRTTSVGSSRAAPCMIAPEAALEQIYAVTHMLGVPIAKVEGPTTSLTFIGTAIDTVRMIAFIPPAKLAAAIADFMLWQTRMFATQKQWQSLAGTLEWLTRVVLWGRPHIAQAIRLSTKRRGAHTSATFRHEISWWISVLKTNPSVPLSFHCDAPEVHRRDRRL